MPRISKVERAALVVEWAVAVAAPAVEWVVAAADSVAPVVVDR